MLGNSEMENCIFNFISRILIDTSKVKAEAAKRFLFLFSSDPASSHGESAYCPATLYYDIYVWIGLNGMLVRSLLDGITKWHEQNLAFILLRKVRKRVKREWKII